MILRRSTDGDSSEIEAVLRDLDLWYPTIRMEDCWVASEGSRIVAVACLEEVGDHLFLSSLGVIPSLRGRGIASRLVDTIEGEASSDIYLYTIIPGFFERLGFERATAPDKISRREAFECERCEPDKCVCMVRHCDVS